MNAPVTATPDPRKRPRRPKTNVDTPQLKGTVKWFDPVKGYGFIERPDEKDVFVHINNLPEGVDVVDPGQVVLFQTESTGKGIRAVNVVLES